MAKESHQVEGVRALGSVVEEVSMYSVPSVGGARPSQHHLRNVFCKYKLFYQKKKLSQELGLFLDCYCV